MLKYCIIPFLQCGSQCHSEPMHDHNSSTDAVCKPTISNFYRDSQHGATNCVCLSNKDVVHYFQSNAFRIHIPNVVFRSRLLSAAPPLQSSDMLWSNMLIFRGFTASYLMTKVLNITQSFSGIDNGCVG